MTLLSSEIIEPQGNKADACVIWLHGLGASGHDFVPIVGELHLPASMAVRFVFPHAPAIAVTINGGMVMPAWYDILAMAGAQRQLNVEQLMASVDAVAALIGEQRAQGIASERIVLAGFSQGGAVAYQLALTYAEPLAGLMTMSTYFPTSENLVPSAANKSLPIHVFHGSRDPMVAESMGRDALTELARLGYQPEYKSYDMEHELCLPQIADISQWLQRVLA
ncbi:MAG: dienelactone hydrolase family protein [Gammaproteobacteria bacterium]|nr:dienelactone hydrolase family protein [Gammaproteobacteria bacterium]MBQ0840369.1 dienelactone hydrolase family protein [Gammaproteobacteria bacterium]